MDADDAGDNHWAEVDEVVDHLEGIPLGVPEGGRSAGGVTDVHWGLEWGLREDDR